MTQATMALRQQRMKARGDGEGDRRGRDFVQDSNLYQEFLAEREEILKHKWIESEKAGFDIGFERALLDWIRHHRDEWRRCRRKRLLSQPGTSH